MNSPRGRLIAVARAREGAGCGNRVSCAVGRLDAGEEAVCRGWPGIPGRLASGLTATLRVAAGSGLDRIDMYTAKPSTVITPAIEIIQALLKFPPPRARRLPAGKHHCTQLAA
ncbi:MAG: hypothetical protein ACM34G_15930 [Acidobacteriota bacterium]